MKKNLSTSKFASFEEFAAYLDGLGLFHMDMGLGRIRAALAALNLAAPAWLGVQTVGTNGKGSTSVMLAALFQSHGFTTGLFTSPHFLSVRERIRINGAMLPESDWLDAANAVFAVYDPPGEERLTYFELLTAMAARLFASHGVTAAVFETGLGGRYDAASALSHSLTVYTPIGEDHKDVLGDNPEKIALDKAGAMRLGVPAITGPQRPEVLAILRRETQGRNLLLQDRHLIRFAPEIGLIRPCRDAPGPVIEDIVLGLPGAYQEQNARLALASFYFLADHKRFPIDPVAVRQAMSRAFIPGRLQRVRPSGVEAEVILDCAHNLPALAALRQALARDQIEPDAMVFACLRDKNPQELAPRVLELAQGPIAVPEIDAPGRAMPAAETAAILGERAVPAAGVPEALASLSPGANLILVCGSMYLLAGFFAQWPETLGLGGDDCLSRTI
mgnify:CR=1 FL=1